MPLFRHTPRVFDRLWDAPWVIRLASKRQIKVDPKSLGEMTVSMLRGEHGFQAKEIAKLLDWLRTEPRVRRHQPAVCAAARPGRAAAPRAEGADLLHAAGRGPVPRRPRRADTAASRSTLIRAASAHVDAFLPGQRVLPRLHARLSRRAAREDAAGAARHQHGRLRARGRRRATSRSRSAISRGSRRRRACTCCARPTGCCASARPA